MSPLALDFDNFANAVGGSGRAKRLWGMLRRGIDPTDLFLDNNDESFGKQAKKLCTSKFARIRDAIASVSNVQVSNDGTTKILLRLQKDGLEVESVIIPWDDRKKSTLCISSQVGCRQGCTFCMTGRMGRLRSLSSDEILSQMFHAASICEESDIHPIDNIVFMGMGEPADNAEAVLESTKVLVDDRQFQITPRKVTISTVAPDPSTFSVLGKSSAVLLAWSVHSSRDELWKQLVPTTNHSMVELRSGLIQALRNRSRRLRSIMLEVTLLDKINDSLENANHLATFCFPILQSVPHTKIVINLIPCCHQRASSVLQDTLD